MTGKQKVIQNKDSHKTAFNALALIAILEMSGLNSINIFGSRFGRLLCFSIGLVTRIRSTLLLVLFVALAIALSLLVVSLHPISERTEVTVQMSRSRPRNR
jgi:hypothetical protein